MNITFIGGGHMATALIAGLAAQHRIIVVDRNADKLQRLHADFGVTTAAADGDLGGAVADADVVFLAVRPPQIQALCKSVVSHLGKTASPLVISVAAALRVGDLSRWLGGYQKIIRAMPNTPAQLKCGMTLLYAAPSAVSDAQKQQATSLFSQVGKAAWLSAEELVDAATAISGSGPGYFYYWIEGMQKAAAQMGLDEPLATQLILQTMHGAAAMVAHHAAANPPATAADLCRAVAVPGGTTEQALAVMKNRQLHAIFKDALLACRDRATALSQQLAADSD